MTDLGITADDLPDGAILKWDPVTGIRVRKVRIDDASYALVTEQLMTQAFLDLAHEERMDSAGTSWGDGKIIGRLPLNILTDEGIGLMDAIRNYDDAFLGRFLNANPALKTRDRI